MATQFKAASEVECDRPLPVRRGLSIDVKRRIIELFAQFHRVTDVQSKIKTEFGLDLDARTIQHFDCSRPQARVGKGLRALYDAHRQAYVERSADVAIAHRAHRLRMLQQVVEKAEKAKDFGNAIKGLELAAKEMGGVLEGKSEVKHVGQVAHVHLSVEDAKRELAMRLSEVIEGGKLEALPKPDEQG